MPGNQKPKPAMDPDRYWGMFRGKVVDNLDPMELNRLLIEVPTLPSTIASFAMPCQPYGGIQVGMVLTPPIGANVWVEFENGDPSYPVWLGCFWTEGEKPALAELPTQQVFSTGSFNAMINDIPGEAEFLLEWGPPGFEVPCTLSINTEAVTFTVGEVVFSVTPEEASALMEPTNIVMTPEGFVITAPAEINITAPEISVEGNVTQTGAVEITGNTEIAGAVEIEGNVEIAGAVEIEGNIEIAGAVEIEGNVEIAGAVEIEGEVNVLGAVEVEGDVGILGAIEIAGDVAMVGAIEVAGDIALAGAMEIAGALVSPVYSPGVGNFA
jgi:cytoskeletal protein CcmA (bactofilin family)